MPITKNDNRQAPTIAQAAFAIGDFDASGVAEVAIDMPAGAVVVGGDLIIDVAFNNQVSDTITVGDAGNNARYKAGIDGQSAARTALIPTGYVVVGPSTGSIMLKRTAGGAEHATPAGSGRLIVEYIYTNRGDFFQR